MNASRPTRYSGCVCARLAVLLAALAVGLSHAIPAEPGKSEAGSAVRQFTVAKALQERKQFGPAAEKWAEFLKNHASDARAADALCNLGICQFGEKKFTAAAATFIQVITAHPKSDARETAWLHLGLAQYNLAADGQAEFYAKAADNLAKYLKLFPNRAETPQATFFLAEALNASDKKAEAVEVYTRLIAKFPKNALAPDALYALGAAHEALGQAVAAGANYDAYLKRFPAGPQAAEVTLRRGETLFAQKDYEQAAKWFATAAARPGFGNADIALFRQATALYELKRYGEAADVYTSVAQKFPQSKQLQAAQLAAGKSACLAGDLDRGREQLTKLIAGGGAIGAEAAHWLAAAYLQQQRPDEALKLMEAAMPAAAATPLAAQLALDRANALYQLPTRRGDSVAAFAEIADKHAQNRLAPQALYMAAFAALEVGDGAKALELSDRFLKQFANDERAADVEYIAAEANLRLGRFDAAIAGYDRLLKNHPRRSEASTWRIRRGLALFSKKNYAEVVASLEPLLSSLHAKSLLAEAAYLVGGSQNELRHYDAALRTLSKGLAAEPQGQWAADTLFALALAERRLNHPAAALRHLRQIVASFADRPVQDRAHFDLAETAYAAGDSATAQAEYKLVIEKFPQSPLTSKALYGLAWVRITTSDFSGAVDALDTLLAKDAAGELAPRARFARGLARVELKEFAPALDDVQAYLQSDPAGDDKRNAQYVLGVCQARLNRNEEAARTFRVILDQNPAFTGGDKVLYELALTLRSLGRGEEATDAFRRLAKEYANGPLAPQALFEVGETEYQAGNDLAAAASFHKSMQNAGKNALGEKAAHKLGLVQFRQNAFDKARRTFAYQLATWPKGILADDAAFMVAEALFKQDKYADALPYYQRVKSPAGKEVAGLAALRAGQTQGRLKQWQASLATLAQATKEHSNSEHLPEMLCEEAWARQNLGQLDLALKLYEEVTAKSEAEVAARARFRIGEIYSRKMEHDKAIKNFIKAAYGYGYPRWQAHAHYEAGRCYEALGKKEQAVKSYREVTGKFPHSEQAAPAKRRLAALTAAK